MFSGSLFPVPRSLFPGEIRDDESRRIPDLVRKIARALEPLVRQPEVIAGRAAGRQREAQRIAAVLVDRLERIDDITQALRHLPSPCIADEAMQIDVSEWHFAHVV